MAGSRWSARVTRESNALDLERSVCKRAGKNLSASQRKVLERAKDELRELYGKA